MLAKLCSRSPGLMRSGEYPPSHPGHLLEYRHANFFGCTRIDGRFVDDGRSPFEVLADRDAGRFERAEIGLPRGVDRGGNGHDDEFRALEPDRILGDTQEPRFLELCGGQLASRVHAVLKVLDFLARQVVPDGWAVLSERHRERKPDIAQTDDPNSYSFGAFDCRLQRGVRSFKYFQHIGSLWFPRLAAAIGSLIVPTEH